MFENITVLILAIIAFSFGGWVWWFTNQEEDTESSDSTNNHDSAN